MAALLACVWSISASWQPAQAADRFDDRFVLREEAVVHRVVITVNKSRTLRIDRVFTTATVGSPEIVDALPISDQVIYIQGKRVGTTNVSVFDGAARPIGVIDVEVVPDTATLQHKIRAIGAGSAGIRVSSSGNQIVLSGVAADSVAADRAVSLAKGLAGDKGEIVNVMQVAPTQQVLLEVRFLEVSREASRRLGVNWFGAGPGGVRGVNTGLPGGSQLPVGTSPRDPGPIIADESGRPRALPPIGNLPIIQGTGTLLAPVGTNPFITILANVLSRNGTTLDVLITALEEKGLVRRLAEPNLMALSGDKARFLAGGEFPVPVPQTTAAGVTITIEWKRFGVELEFTPTVLSRGTINLAVLPSVSELDFARAVQIQGFLIPLLIKRDARTVVELRDGQSFAIAGLLQTEQRRNLNQVPWLGSVPVLGALFRSAEYQANETDLVIIVTPRLVSPAVPGDRLASPLESRLPSNDVDFFLNGQPEVKKRYTEFVSAGTGLQGPYGHIIRPEVGHAAAVVKPAGPVPKSAGPVLKP